MSNLNPSSDPFQSPSPEAEEPSTDQTELKKWERQALDFYLQNRDKRVGWAITRQLIPIIIGMGIALVGIIFVAEIYLPADDSVIPVAFGTVGGMLAAHLLMHRRFALFWPTLRECIDWPAVEGKLGLRTSESEEKPGS